MHATLAAQLIDTLQAHGYMNAGAEAVARTRPLVARWAKQQLTPVAKAKSLRNLAKVLNWAGKHHEAGELAMEALQELPDDAKVLLLAAARLREFQRVDEALKLAARAVEQQPDWASTQQLYGQLLAEQNRWPEAIAAFQRWTELTPEDAVAWRMYNAALMSAQRDEESRIALERVDVDADSQDSPAIRRVAGDSRPQAEP